MTLYDVSKILFRHPSCQLIVCLLLEFILISSSICLAVVVRFSNFHILIDKPVLFAAQVCVTSVVCLLCISYVDLYDLRTARKVGTLVIKFAKALATAMVALMVTFYLVPSLIIGRGVLGLSFVLAWVGLVSWRCLYQRLYKLPSFQSNVVIVGTDEQARSLANILQHNHMLGFQLKGLIGSDDEVGKDLQ